MTPPSTLHTPHSPSLLAGIDIGGTKCALSLAALAPAHSATPPSTLHTPHSLDILSRTEFPTPPDGPAATFARLTALLDDALACRDSATLAAIGISCGGPLDSRSGIILCPPNLPGWVDIDAVTPLRERYRVPVAIQNDANACALAEWRHGAGRGTRNMIFLTFGTGMGAGLILDGKLYSGTSDMGGEVGHLRLAPDGPVGFGKAGSFEGFCSGGGIARLGASMARDALARGTVPAYCATPDDIGTITAKAVFAAAHAGDPTAAHVVRISSEKLGHALALLTDVLNPELIVIGSIYLRNRALIDRYMLPVLRAEAIPYSLDVLRIAPPGLGERVGDYAAFAVAEELLHRA